MSVESVHTFAGEVGLALLRRPCVAGVRRRPLSFARVTRAALGCCGALFLVILADTAQAARPLLGTVRDAQTLLPVPHALIELATTGEVVQADAEGRFRFGSLPDGTYALCVRRIGYADRCDISVTIGPEEFLLPVVYLTSLPLQGQVVEVTDSLRHPEEASRTVLTRKEIVRSGAASAADALVHTPEVEILRASNGTARVSIRGSSPEGVRILVDDVPLSASGQAADLASIPACDIERIEIIRGPAVTAAGADALAGAILITTRRAAGGKGAYGRAGAGSFGSREGAAGVDGLGVGQQRLGAFFSSARSDGDFSYYDDQFQTDTARGNNESWRQSWSVRAAGGVGRRWHWSAGLQGFDLRAGVPGLEYELTPEASRDETRTSGSAGLEFRAGSASAYASYAAVDDWNHYLNTGTLAYDSEQRARWHVWRGGAELGAGGLKQISLLGEAMEEDFWGEDHRQPAHSFGTATRSSRAASAAWSPVFRFGRAPLVEAWARLAYRYDYTRTQASYPTTPISPVIDPPVPVWEISSPSVSGGFAGKLGDVDWSARGSYGRAFRRPPVLEQFWVESYRTRGNPGLQPERSEQWEFGYALNAPAALGLKFEQRFYWGDYLDLIYWRTGQGGVWSPDNIGSARVDGREESLQWAVAGGGITFRIDHLFTDHENTAGEPNTDGEPLPMRYRHKVAAGAHGETAWGFLDLSYRWFDRRYLREAGTASKSLDPYGVFDTTVGVRRRMWGVNVEAVARLFNLTASEYEIIEREPMPGRNFSFTLHVSTPLQ